VIDEVHEEARHRLNHAEVPETSSLTYVNVRSGPKADALREAARHKPVQPDTKKGAA
jgi:hypothetical protein